MVIEPNACGYLSLPSAAVIFCCGCSAAEVGQKSIHAMGFFGMFFLCVDGRNPANQLIGSLSHYLQGFLHPGWCRISSTTVF